MFLILLVQSLPASLKTQQRDSNAILARQLEQAVVQVAQSNNQDVNEQIQAVLGYARQLRQQDYQVECP